MSGKSLHPRRIPGAILVTATILLIFSCATPPPPNPVAELLEYSAERPFPESSFATVGGVRVHYRIWNPKESPAGKVMLLHGVGGSTYTFRNTAPLLAQAGYSVVAIDRPAFGFSDPGRDFTHSLSNLSELLWTIADRLDTEGNSFTPADPWYLLGHADGGLVASRMALDRPSRTLGLVLVDSEIAHPEKRDTFMWFPPTRWVLQSWLKNSLYTQDGVTELLGDAYGRPPTYEEIAGYLAPLIREGMAQGYVNYARTSGDTELPLEEITTQTLLIWGKADGWVKPEYGELADSRLPDSRFRLIPGAGHAPMDTHPDEVHRIVIDWIYGRLE